MILSTKGISDARGKEKTIQETDRRSMNRDTERLAALDRLAADMKKERQNPKRINYDSFGGGLAR